MLPNTFTSAKEFVLLNYVEVALAPLPQQMGSSMNMAEWDSLAVGSLVLSSVKSSVQMLYLNVNY